MSFDVSVGAPLTNLGSFTAISSDGGAPSAATLGAMVDAGLNPTIDPAAGQGLRATFDLAQSGLAMGVGGAIRAASPVSSAPAVAVSAPAAPRQPGLNR